MLIQLTNFYLNPQFQYPQFLWSLVAVPLIILLYAGYQLWRRRAIKRMGDPALVKSMFPAYAPVKNVFRFIFFIIAFTLGCLAIANPRQPDDTQEEVRKGIDVVLAMDISNSMLATDVAPSRLQRAKMLLSRLIDAMPEDRVGLVLFAGNAYIQMPLTTDHGAAKLFITAATPGTISAQGTAISDALDKSSLAFQTENDRFKTVVLVSDGETHDDNAVQTAQTLAQKGMMINTVGIGSVTGAAIFDTATGTQKRDASGAVVLSRLNEALLQQVAKSTNGIYINLQNTDEAITALKSQFSGIEKKAFGDASSFTYKTFYAWLALPMLLLLVLELFMGDRKKVKK